MPATGHLGKPLTPLSNCLSPQHTAKLARINEGMGMSDYTQFALLLLLAESL